MILDGGMGLGESECVDRIRKEKVRKWGKQV